MKVFFSFLALLFFSAAFALFNNADRAKLQGTWVSRDDKNYTMVFKGSVVAEYYEKEKTSESNFILSKDTLVKTDINDGQVYRYAVTLLTANNLVLIYLDRGNLLRFRRKAAK